MSSVDHELKMQLRSSSGLEADASGAEEVDEEVLAEADESLLHGTSSIGRVTFNFVNTVVGSGILAIPHALYDAGLVTGLVMAILVCLISVYSVQLVVTTGIHEGVKDYEQLMDKLFGFYGYTFILLALFLYDFGAMLSYLIILGDVCTQVVREIAIDWFGAEDTGYLSSEWALRRLCIVLPAVVLMFPLCLLRDISRLEKVSSVAVYVTLFIIVVVIIASCEHKPPDGARDDDPWFTVTGDNPSSAFGVFAFAFVCHDTAFMFFGSLRNPTKNRWRKTASLSLAVSFVICVTFALPGYVAFRSATRENILNNFPTDDTKIVVVRILFMLTMSFTYPICFFICRHIVNELLYRFENRHTPRIPGTPAGLSIRQIPFARHFSITSILFVSSVVICCFVKDLGLVMSLTGNISAVSVAFIMPPLCAISSRVRRKREGHYQQPLLEGPAPVRVPMFNEWDAPMIRYAVLLAFGCFTMVFCTLMTIKGAS